MNFNRHLQVVLLTMAGLAVMVGCTTPPASSTAANTISMLRVLDTKVVGKPVWVSAPDSAAIVEMNESTLPANLVLVGLDQNRQITAVLVTTKYARHKYQGFTLISGSLGDNDDVALPGSEYEVAVTNDIKSYKQQQMNTTPMQETAGAARPSTSHAI